MTAVHELSLALLKQTNILEKKIIRLRIDSCLHNLSVILLQILYENRKEIHEKIKSICPKPIVLGKFVYSEMLESGELNIQHQITDDEDWIVFDSHPYFAGSRTSRASSSGMLHISKLNMDHIFKKFTDVFIRLSNLYSSFVLEKGKVTEQDIDNIEKYMVDATWYRW